MLTHEEMIEHQATKHELIQTESFCSREEYVLHLIHTAAYVHASRSCEDKRVLDFGCNTGYGAKILSKSARKVVGVDVSENAISAAKNEYGHLGIEFQKFDGKKLPFKDDAFDLIDSFQVIEHIVDYTEYIEELKRVLSKRGALLFTTPNAFLRLDPGMKPWNDFHVREFNHDEFKVLLETFFPYVSVLGLFANEPLYSIEVNRLAAARERARLDRLKSSPYQKFSLRTFVKALLPDALLHRIIEFRIKREREQINDLMNKHGIDDFSYRQHELHNALDLLAICCNDIEVLENTQHTLFMN